MKDTGGTVRRWLDLIQEFDFTVTHWSGKNNINADLISHAKHMSEPSPSDIESITQGKEDIYPLPWKHVNNSSKHIPKPSRKSTPLSSCPPQEEDSFYPRKWIILLISSSCGVNQKRNSGGIPFEESSAVTPQVEYSFLPPNRMVLLISSSCGESSSFPPFEENSPKEELCRNSF